MLHESEKATDREDEPGSGNKLDSRGEGISHALNLEQERGEK